MSVKLILINEAKRSGGDKYKATGQHWTDKDRFIYVPQHISRKPDGSIYQALMMTISLENEGIVFEMIKPGSTGDDRYGCDNDWTGDIYVPQTYRNQNGRIHVHISIEENGAPIAEKAPAPKHKIKMSLQPRLERRDVMIAASSPSVPVPVPVKNNPSNEQYLFLMTLLVIFLWMYIHHVNSKNRTDSRLL